MIYRWKPFSQTGLPAQVVGEEFERIQRLHGGQLVASAVVMNAQLPGSPLHPAFEWDNLEAAHQHRLSQARYLIRSLTTVVETPSSPVEVRAYVSIDRDEGADYLPVLTVMNDRGLRAVLLTQALRDLESFERRYAAFEELAEIFVASAKVRAAK